MQIRERIRRAEEDAATLLEQHHSLAAQLRARSGRAAWLVVVGGVIGTTFVGYGLGSFLEERHAERVLARREAEESAELGYQRMRAISCQGLTDRTLADLSACKHGLADRAKSVANQTSAAIPCACEPADPLCQCPIDRGAVAASLTAAQSPIRMCFVPAKALSFHAKVTFAARTGEVESAVLDSTDGNMTEADRSCVLAVLARVKVPAFGGASVSVGKTFTVRGP